MKNALLVVAALLSLAGCGGADNVGACEKWKTAAKCGTAANAGFDAITCSSYANLSCDISDYFDCLSTAYVCTNGMYDVSKLSNATNCASKAVCK